MAQTSQEPFLPSDFLKQFDALVALGKWGSTGIKKTTATRILDPLKNKIQKDLPSKEEHQGYISALGSLASNPLSLRDFAEHVIMGTYQNTTFMVRSLSKISTPKTFANLGIQIISGHPIDAMLQEIKSEAFQNLHVCEPISEGVIPVLNGKLKDRLLLYPGDSEHVARATINTHIEFLFDLQNAISAMLELWLARLTSEHQPAVMEHTDRNQTYQTYLTGRTDYMVLTITNTSNGVPSAFSAGSERNKILEELELANCHLYSQLPGHIINKLQDDQGWEALFLEAKSTNIFSQGKINVSKLYQVITTCCIARTSGQNADKVIKFSLSSGHHWIFGVVDNTTSKSTAYVTTILDNSDFQSTHDVIRLLFFWMVLPGRMLKDNLFAKIIPRPQSSIIETTSKSRTMTGKYPEGMGPKVGGEEGVLGGVEEDSVKEEGSRGDDTGDEGEDSGTDDDDKEDEGESESEGEEGPEDDEEEISNCGSGESVRTPE